MKYFSKQICFQEVPNEVSLSYLITGCNSRCKGCHSPQSWNGNIGTYLSEELFISHLDKYTNLITCVLFLGGEWEEEQLIKFLSIAKSKGLKTCLYTGKEEVSKGLLPLLDYTKTGPYKEELGGLDSIHTNQIFLSSTGESLNKYFLKT